jgi:hypothetical protein
VRRSSLFTIERMSAANAFLKEFMAMRKTLAPSGVAGDTKLVPQAGKGKGKGKATGSDPIKMDGITLAKIIEEKPKPKEIVKFLQDRCNELTIKKMA